MGGPFPPIVNIPSHCQTRALQVESQAAAEGTYPARVESLLSELRVERERQRQTKAAAAKAAEAARAQAAVMLRVQQELKALKAMRGGAAEEAAEPAPAPVADDAPAPRGRSNSPRAAMGGEAAPRRPSQSKPPSGYVTPAAAAAAAWPAERRALLAKVRSTMGWGAVALLSRSTMG